jgi:uncharacterized protein (TIGR00369 family)
MLDNKERENQMLLSEKEKLFNEIQEDFLMSPFAASIGINVSDFTEGEVKLEVPIKEHQFNTMGTVHGGVYATLMDIVMAMAIRSVVKGPSVTVNISVNYISAISEGSLYVNGTIVKQGYRLVIADAKIYDQNDVLLANASGTFRVIRGKEK